MGSRFWSTSRLFIWRRFVWSWPNAREGRILAAACLLSLSRFVCSWPNVREGRFLPPACLLSLSRYVWSWPKAREGRFLAAACIYLLVDLNINGQTLATVDIQRLMALTFAVVCAEEAKHRRHQIFSDFWRRDFAVSQRLAYGRSRVSRYLWQGKEFS